MFEKLPLILNGGRHVESKLVEFISDAAPIGDLTPRERQTLNMILSGKSNAEIASLMGISPKTTEKHRASLMQKMGVHSIVELMSTALKEGLLEEHGHLD